MAEYVDNIPVYKQLEDLILRNIKTGVWPVHSKIKDEIALAVELQVSRGTLRKAIKKLVSDGVLSQIKGKGTFVVSAGLEQPLASRLISFSEAMEERSLSYKTIVLKKEIIIPDIKVSAFLDLPNTERVLAIERVRLVDNYPTIYLKNYVPVNRCPGLIDDDLEREKLFALIEKKYNHMIHWGRRYFKAVSAYSEVAFNLGLNPGAPVMFLEQVTYTKDNVPIEYSNVWINSEKFEIVSILPR